MRVLTFMPEFHEAIRSGVKRSTIRAKARCKPGDELSLRCWTGLPYRSPQAELRAPVRCQGVLPVALWSPRAGVLEVLLAGARPLHGDALEAFARGEGFADFATMQEWFLRVRKIKPGHEFLGELIHWNPDV